MIFLISVCRSFNYEPTPVLIVEKMGLLLFHPVYEVGSVVP